MKHNNAPVVTSPVALALRSIIAMLTTQGGDPISGEIERDVLEDVPSKGTILEALKVSDRPFELLEAWNVLDQIELKLEGGTTASGLSAFYVVVTCRKLLRAVENQGDNPWDPKVEQKAAGPVIDEAARARKDAKRAAEKAYRAKLVAKLTELKVQHDPCMSTAKLETAIIGAGGKLPSKQPTVVTPAPKVESVTPVVVTQPVVVAQAPAPVIAEAKPRVPNVSPERLALLKEIEHYGVALERPVTEYTNSELRWHLGGARNRQRRRVEDLRRRWLEVDAYSAKNLNRPSREFPVTESSLPKDIDTAQVALEHRERFAYGGSPSRSVTAKPRAPVSRTVAA